MANTTKKGDTKATQTGTTEFLVIDENGTKLEDTKVIKLPNTK